MRAPIRLGVTLAAPGIALALASPGVGEAPPPGAAAVLVQVRERTATGLVLNTLGHIAVPILSEQDGDWTVEADGERYPARVVSRQKRYGFLILKVEREKPFAYGVLASKQGQLPGRYVLLARGDGGTPIETPGVTIRQVRRRIPEAGLDGSYYALSIPGDSAPDGSLLLDPATAEVHGVLLPPLQGSADRYAAFAASLAERAALQNVPLGAAELP